MEWTEEKVRELQRIAYQTDVSSLDELIGNELMNERREVTAKIDLLGSNEVEEKIDAAFTCETLLKFVNKLRPREIKVLTLRFGLDGNGQRTLEEVGQQFGVTRERMRQIEVKALSHLKTMMAKAGINNRDDI